MPVLKHYIGCTEELSQELEKNFKYFIVNWNSVRAIVIGFPFEFNRSSSWTGIRYERRVDFLKFASVLCKALVNHRCTDVSLIADVLYLICLMCSTPNDTAIEHYLDWLRRMFFENNSRRGVNKFEELLKIPYNKSSSFLKPREDIVRFAATTGNVGLLDVLLQFGAMPRRPEDDEYEHENLHRTCRDLFKWGYGLMFEFLGKHLLQSLHTEFSKDAKRRVYLMMIVMSIFKEILILTQNDDDTFLESPQPHFSRESLLRINGYRDCVRKLFAVIPDPFVSSDEIRKTVGKLCLNILSYDDIDQLAKKYEYHFPESRETSAPRHLQHLCKVQVRESLRAAGTLTHGADLLPITKTMKDYVLLKDVYSPGNAISFEPRIFENLIGPSFLSEGFQPKRRIGRE